MRKMGDIHKKFKRFLFGILSWGVFFLVFFNTHNSYCQDRGLKYITNYTTGMHLQNWSVLQDNRGIIYVANNGCIWEYDGATKRIINIPNWFVRSLAKDDEGTVYVGGVNQLGYLEMDPQGVCQYVSLLDYIADSQKEFSTVYQIIVTREGIYYRTKKFLFRWNSEIKKMDVWEPDTEFNAGFTWNGRLFIHQSNVGLMQMVNDSLKMISGDETFASEKIYMMVPYTEGAQKVLIGTRSKGFYIYDGLKAEPFPTEVDDYVRDRQLYGGIRLNSSASSGEFALATLHGGLVVIDGKGKLIHIFNKLSGLQDNFVTYVYEDYQGNLWTALDKGLSKIEYPSSFSYYNDSLSNLPGNVLSITRFKPQNMLMVGTTRGLFALSPDHNLESPGQFQPVTDIQGSCWDLLSGNDFFLAATTNGVYSISGNLRFKEKILDIASYVLHRSYLNSNRILVGTRLGLTSLFQKQDKWVFEHHFKNIDKTVRTIAEDRNGNLWLGTISNGVLKVDFPKMGEIEHPVITRFNDSHGLPGGEVKVFEVGRGTIFAAGRKLYRFNEKNRTFFLDYSLGKEFTDGSLGVFALVEDQQKNVWFHAEFRNFQGFNKPDGTFFVSGIPFLRIPKTQVNVIYPEPDGTKIWFGCQDALIQYDTGVRKNYQQDFSVLIREVTINDIALMYNAEEGKYKINPDWKKKISSIPYKDRNITFEFAAPFFEDENSNEYRYLLEGYDKEWSRWKPETKKAYTNLDSGSYTFRVQARNVYDHLSRESLFKFKVLPPWYQTWWAYSCYAILFISAMLLTFKWRSGKLEREKKRLEHTVKERTGELEKRTSEIHEKNRQLESQTIQLKEQSEKLKEMDNIKSRFFANISHEFRTPLTLIIGPLEQMLSTFREKEEEKTLQMMLRNSQRLLRLINQLLDLSKLDSGRMKLQASLQNIVPFLRGMTSSFEMLTKERQLELSFLAEEENITLYFDVEKMEAIISNLLVNAVKFTPGGGKISVKVRKSKDTGLNPGEIESTRKKWIEISVSDTGIGIPRENLAHIFDRFYQVGEKNANGKDISRAGNWVHQDFQGTGLGLALTRELVLLHHGIIDVYSRRREASGTEFIIRLPMGKEHLAPGDIVLAPQEMAINREPQELKAFFPVQKDDNEHDAIDTDGTGSLEEPEPGEKEIILVVEDNADARQFIRGALEPFYTVEEAIDGSQGIDAAKNLIPDLVVSDIMMPGVDGYELCNVLKNDIKTSHIPIILLTAKASESSVIQGLETGADDYITKPFNTKILLARIKNLIDLRRRLHYNVQQEMVLQPAEIKVSSMDQKFLEEVQEVIEKNISDEFFNVDQMGKKLYMSRTTLYRKILALTGQTPREFIKSYRLKRGAQLLKAKFGNITEVALEVGFSSTTYFSKCFKEKFSQLPSDFLVSLKE